jgi:hypothetical protein
MRKGIDFQKKITFAANAPFEISKDVHGIGAFDPVGHKQNECAALYYTTAFNSTIKTIIRGF